jgi:hypothetical protein
LRQLPTLTNVARQSQSGLSATRLGNTVTWVRSRLRALTTLSVLGVALLAASPATAADNAAAHVPGPVVLIGTGGLGWADVDSDLPALNNLLNRDASGWLADRSVRTVACPVDGWLAVSAGRRAGDVQVGPAVHQKAPSCREPQLQVPTPGGQATVPQWGQYRREADGDTFEATPGLLGDALAKAGKSAAAVGPGAAIALADGQGRVAHAWTGRRDGASGTVAPTVLSDDVTSALKTHPDLLVVDLGPVRDPDRLVPGEPKPTGGYARPVKDQIQALDARLGLVLDQLPANATVIVASIADAGPQSSLQLLAASGPAPLGGVFAQSLLGSRSTRQDGLAQTTDLLPTVLTALGVDIPDEAVGAALKPVQPGRSVIGRLEKLNDVVGAATTVTHIVPRFFLGLVIAQLLLYGGATLVLRRRLRGDHPAAALTRRTTLRSLRQVAVVFASVPAATFLANVLPWWRAGRPGLAVTGAVILFMFPIGAIALLGPWRKALLGPMGAVGAITAAVLAGDVLTGSHLILSSLMGLQPIVAGRFYGFGNVQFALFAAGALLLAIALADWQLQRGSRRRAVMLIVVIGVLATLIDGTPGIGSDFGGPPALIPAFAVLALMVAGVRVTWRRALMIAGVTIGVIVLLSVLDWLRPAGDRTHLGRFVQSTIDGGAWPVIQRKGAQNLRILFTSYLSALLPFAAAFIVLVLARPVAWGVRPLQLAYDRSPVLRSGLVAFGVMVLIGMLLNDSGTAVPADAATVAIPLLIAASVRALELQDAERLEAAVAAARKPRRSRR